MSPRTPSGGQRVARQDGSLAQFLDAVSLRILRYLAAFEFLQLEADRLLQKTPRAQLSELNEDAGKNRASAVRQPVLPVAETTSGGVIDKREPLFQESIKLIQADIRAVISFMFGRKVNLSEYPHIHALLTLSHEELEVRYGSISQAWDSLAVVKHKLTLPDQKEFGIVSWHISCTSEPERLIREVVALCFYHLGATDLRSLLATCFDKLDIALPVETVIDYEKTSQAVAQVLVNYMRQSSANTLNVASLLAEELKLTFMEDTSGLNPGLLQLLDWVPRADDALMRSYHGPLRRDKSTQSERVFVQLLDWRRYIIHISVDGDFLAQLRPHLPLFERPTPLDYHHLADFAAGVGLNLALDVVSALLGRALARNGKGDKAIAERQWKMAAELRVAHLNMLKNGQWGFAWVAGPAIEKIVDPDRQDMSRMNAWFAQTQLAKGQFAAAARTQLAKYEPSSARPRYHLMKRAILEEDQLIPPILDEALKTNDLTMAELETWPVFARFRTTHVWSKWLKEHTA